MCLIIGARLAHASGKLLSDLADPEYLATLLEVVLGRLFMIMMIAYYYYVFFFFFLLLLLL